MTIEEIRELLQMFNESGVGELELQRGEDRLRLRKTGEPASMQFSNQQPSAPATAIPGEEALAKAPEADAGQHFVPSPIVGTFYESPSPGSPAFVKIGDHVEADTVLCIIESMKLMNEINAEVAGVITAKLVENGRPVEYGTKLFAIQPR